MASELPAPPPYEEFVPKYLTYVPGRNIYQRRHKGFKQHKNIGHAKLAINQALYNYGYNGSAHRMGIWEFNFETKQWDLLYDIAPGTLIRNLPWRDEK
jgi:hypothetical protein